MSPVLESIDAPEMTSNGIERLTYLNRATRASGLSSMP